MRINPINNCNFQRNAANKNINTDKKTVDNNTAENKNNKKLKTPLLALGLATLVAVATLFVSKKIANNNPLNSNSLRKLLSKNSDRFSYVVSKDKEKLVGSTGIRQAIHNARNNNTETNPAVILKKLKNSPFIELKEEVPFEIRPNSRIQAGRKFPFVFTSEKHKKYNMIFEVHDYLENDGTRNWVMRLYDQDRKASRSYLTRSGSLKSNSYFSHETHIPCGQYGEKFVLGTA